MGISLRSPWLNPGIPLGRGERGEARAFSVIAAGKGGGGQFARRPPITATAIE